MRSRCMRGWDRRVGVDKDRLKVSKCVIEKRREGGGARITEEIL